MKKLIILFILVGTTAFSQQNKVKIGGGIGLGFGDQTTIEIAPNVSYEVLPNMDIGIEADYIYNENKDYHAKQNAFGVGPFARLFFGNLFGYGAYKAHFINERYDTNIGTIKDNRNVNELWLGGGYRTAIGNSSMYFGAMYDVLHNDDSLYSSGFRPYVGIGIGL